MQSPVVITFRDMAPSPAISAHIERRASKLDTFFDGIVKCHVVVEAPHRSSRHGQRFHVRIDLHIPGRELVLSNNDPGATEDLHAAVDDAFGDAERTLATVGRDRVVDTKTQQKPARGIVAKKFAARGFGFIEGEDGREIYFHRNSLLGTGFESLALGTKVRFAEEDGDKGPQASTVHVVGH